MKIYNVKMVNTEMVRGPLNFVEIKNPFGIFQTNPKADAWQVRPIFRLKKRCFQEHPIILSPDLTHPSWGRTAPTYVWHDILSVSFQMTMIQKHFQKIYPNVDLRLVSEGAAGDWSHHSGLGGLPPPGSSNELN